MPDLLHEQVGTTTPDETRDELENRLDGLRRRAGILEDRLGELERYLEGEEIDGIGDSPGDDIRVIAERVLQATDTLQRGALHLYADAILHASSDE